VEKATISQLKNSLSAYLDKVRAGETVLVLDRAKPIARIERVDAGDAAEGGDARLARLERAGLVRRGGGRLSAKDVGGNAPKAKKSVLAALIEDRHESR
jgi:prevent-host-death family protein